MDTDKYCVPGEEPKPPAVCTRTPIRFILTTRSARKQFNTASPPTLIGGKRASVIGQN